jgi:hygromycin-B 4-O-kinase
VTTSGLREAEVAAFVGQHLAGDATAVRGLRHGQWSRAFSFESDGREYVIRFSATDEDFRKDQRAMRYGSAALPVPKIVEVGVAFGGFFAISEHLEGAFLDDLDDVSLRRALPALLSVLDAVRQADIRDTSGFGLWDAAGHGPHASWRDALLACGIDAPGGRTFGWSAGLAERPAARRVFERAYSRLASLVEGCLDERYLVHSDLLAYNVLVDLDADGIAAVLDWGSSLYGDFLWDVAWLTFGSRGTPPGAASTSAPKRLGITRESGSGCPTSSQECARVSSPSVWTAWRIRPSVADGTISTGRRSA